MIIINLSENALKLSKEYADTVVETNLDAYKKRGQSNVKAITEQIYNGKLAEFAVAAVLPNCSEPDLVVYKKKQKSFSCDLVSQDKNIHVKSQTRDVAKKYGTSWVFQKTDPLVTRPTQSDFLALCVLDRTLNTVCLWGVYSMLIAQPLLKEPVLHQLRSTKTVLYWDDFSKYVLEST